MHAILVHLLNHGSSHYTHQNSTQHSNPIHLVDISIPHARNTIPCWFSKPPSRQHPITVTNNIHIISSGINPFPQLKSNSTATHPTLMNNIQETLTQALSPTSSQFTPHPFRASILSSFLPQIRSFLRTPRFRFRFQYGHSSSIAPINWVWFFKDDSCLQTLFPWRRRLSELTAMRFFVC